MQKVAGVRQRTGMLLAAHALVASFLGGTTIRETGLDAWGWIAVGLLVLGLVAAALLLAPSAAAAWSPCAMGRSRSRRS